MNANLDVLELIFARLEGTDLVASALVSRAFLAGAIPSLYASVEYTARHVKRAHHVMSPFATLAAHDHLAVHVKRVAIHAAPAFQSSTQVCPAFLQDLAHALRTTTNLRSFVCAVKLLPPLLPQLVDKARLRHLRIHASLGSRQMAVLQNCTGLHSLSLDSPSWNVIDALPKWTAGMQRTLAHLTLYMSQDIDATVLNATLAQLPRLRGLHVIACPRITHLVVLKALAHTPGLHELSLTIFPTQVNRLPPLNFSTPPLTHLSIDVRASFPGLKPLLARIIARLSPRDALAICGGWIGEIKSSSELADAAQDADDGNTPGDAAGGGSQTPHVPPGPTHGHGHGNDQANDLPLLSHPNFYHGVTYANQNGNAPPNPGNPTPTPIFFGFSLPPGNPSGDDDDDDHGDAPGPTDPPNLGPNPDPDFRSLISAFPSTLSVLHLPQLSPAALREIVERCEGIQVLGIVIGNTFAPPVSVKTSRSTSRFKGHATKSGIRLEVCALTSILACARELRELIIDTSGTDMSGSGTDTRAGSSHGGSSNGSTLLTPPAVRMLMGESSCLRRIVGEGRVWESPTPTISLPVPFPRCLDIELTLSKAQYGPGLGNSHAHGSAGFGLHGGGCGQVEVGNEHWFWLTNSASGGESLQCGF